MAGAGAWLPSRWGHGLGPCTAAASSRVPHRPNQPPCCLRPLLPAHPTSKHSSSQMPRLEVARGAARSCCRRPLARNSGAALAPVPRKSPAIARALQAVPPMRRALLRSVSRAGPRSHPLAAPPAPSRPSAPMGSSAGAMAAAAGGGGDAAGGGADRAAAAGGAALPPLAPISSRCSGGSRSSSSGGGSSTAGEAAASPSLTACCSYAQHPPGPSQCKVLARPRCRVGSRRWPAACLPLHTLPCPAPPHPGMPGRAWQQSQAAASQSGHTLQRHRHHGQGPGAAGRKWPDPAALASLWPPTLAYKPAPGRTSSLLATRLSSSQQP